MQPQNKIPGLHLQSLPAFADFLRKSRLDVFTDRYLAAAYELNVPLLQYFQSLGPAEIVRIAKQGVVRLLDALADETWEDYVATSVSTWVNNQVPVINRNDVLVEDIALVNHARKQAFRDLIRDYTADHDHAFLILEEIDRFLLFIETTMFKTFLEIQEAKLREVNTSLKRREAELLEAQSLGQIGSFEWDLTGQGNSRYTPEVYKIFEFDKTSNLQHFLEDVHPEDRSRVKGAIERALNEGLYECEYRYTRNNKSKVLSSRGKVFFEDGKPVRMVGTVTDVTEKSRLINQLRESEELNKQAQALTHTGNWKWTIADERIEWSDEMYRIYGLEPQSEVITFERFTTFIHPDDRDRRIKEISEAMRSGNASDYVMKINAGDGKEKMLKGKGQILKDKEGVTLGMLGTCQDITNEYLLSRELLKKNEQLLRKNRDLESFNFIASHDMQEPLRKIQFYSNRIAAEGTGIIPEWLNSYFKKICAASAHMQKIIEDFLVFYHVLNQNGALEKVNLDQVLEDLYQQNRECFNNPDAEFTLAGLPIVWGRTAQIRDLFRHLIDNAIKFRAPDRHARVSVTASSQNIDNTSYAVISVADNGIGFDEKHSERIFDLFQRLHTREQYPGSGIGLTLCKRIAEDHGGWIEAKSSPGLGSVFSVFLPTDPSSALKD